MSSAADRKLAPRLWCSDAPPNFSWCSEARPPFGSAARRRSIFGLVGFGLIMILNSWVMGPICSQKSFCVIWSRFDLVCVTCDCKMSVADNSQKGSSNVLEGFKNASGFRDETMNPKPSFF